MGYKLSREDRLALLNSEIFQELERAERIKQAQTLSDKIIQSPVAQKAISDGIAKALENKDDDGEMESIHDGIKAGIKKLNDHELFEMCKWFMDEAEARGLDSDAYIEEFKEEELEETEEDEEKEQKDMENIFAFVKDSLTKMAYSCAEKNNMEACYVIERAIQKMFE